MKSPETILELYELARATPPGAGSRNLTRRDHLDFMPAAIEILETPASLYARGIALAVVLFFAAALLWSWLGHIDIIATADGKIIPAGQVKTVQPLEIGVVRNIRVANGEHVEAGQVMIELDPTTTAADGQRVEQDLLVARLDIARLEALLAPTGAPDLNPPPGADAEALSTQRRMLLAGRQEFQAKLAVIDRELDQKRAEAAGARAQVAKLQATIPLIARRAAAKKELLEKQYASLFSYLQLQEDLVGQQHDLVVQQHKSEEIAQTIAALERQRDQTVAAFRRETLDQLSKARQQEDRLVQDSIKARQRTAFQTLTAPVAGTVQQLAVHTVGGVVTPAQQLLVIVPDTLKLEVEARISNRDIGFVAPGQEAKVKVAAFDFTRYGMFTGRVVSVSRDALPADERSGSRELYYAAQIALDRTRLDVDGREIVLGAGMMTTVEIKTGRRRVLDYLLSPVLRYRDDTLRER